MRQPGRPLEGVQRAGEPSLPAVRRRNRVGRTRVAGGAQRDRAQSLSLGGRIFQRPRQIGERTAARPARDVVLREDGLHFVPERARLSRAPLVGRRLANEIEAAARPRARCIEEVPVACDLVGSRQSCARNARRAHAARRRPGTATRALVAAGFLLRARARTRSRSGVCGRAASRSPRSVRPRPATSGAPPHARALRRLPPGTASRRARSNRVALRRDASPTRARGCPVARARRRAAPRGRRRSAA